MTSRDDRSDDPLAHRMEEVARSGAAADSSEPDEKLKMLPRILRYGLLLSQESCSLHARLVAEIEVLCPSHALNIGWAETPDAAHGLALADDLDRIAVGADRSALRSLADCARLLSLPVPDTPERLEAHRRVAKALIAALRNLPDDIDEDLAARSEALVFGWAALPACTDLIWRPWTSSALSAAASLGQEMAKHRIEATEAASWTKMRRHRKETEERLTEAEGSGEPSAQVPQGHVVVARVPDVLLQSPKMRDILLPVRGIVNAPLPLVQLSSLSDVRRQLVCEFPYAEDVVDYALADLVGRSHAVFRPLLVVGRNSGTGKTRFARRLAQCLGIPLWAVNAAQPDGGAFGGTDRRWSTAAVCHPLLAIARARHANPAVLLDAIDKAATRTDFGRLWDCLLCFLERETARSYPDPALQLNVDLSHVSYVATANTLDGLPAHLLDRFRIAKFPKPLAGDLTRLLPNVIAEIALERDLDPRWIAPLSTSEKRLVRGSWQGGSVRLLRRLVETLLRDREARAIRN